MRLRMVLLMTLAIAPLVGAESPGDQYFSAEGVVVAVQKDQDDARINDLHSMGDMVEVWMVRINKWPKSDRPRFILVEYKHRDAVVRDAELDGTVWRFEIQQAPLVERETCTGWWTQNFMPTALGAHRKLPQPKNLGCFLLEKHPLALRDTKAQVAQGTAAQWES